MVDFFYSLGPWNWLILAAILFSVEMVLPGVHLIWFGLAALLTGLLSLAVGVPWQWQLIAFAVLSVITVFVARKYTRSSHAVSDEPDLNVRGAEYIGRTVAVEEPIRGGRGKVRVGDTVWIAQGADTPAGSRVKITGTDGTVLLVERE